MLPACFVLGVQSSKDSRPRNKAQYVIAGHCDYLKLFLVHSVQTILKSSIRLLIAVTAMVDSEFSSNDIKLEYLQSSDMLDYMIYIKKRPKS